MKPLLAVLIVMLLAVNAVLWVVWSWNQQASHRKALADLAEQCRADVQEAAGSLRKDLDRLTREQESLGKEIDVLRRSLEESSRAGEAREREQAAGEQAAVAKLPARDDLDPVESDDDQAVAGALEVIDDPKADPDAKERAWEQIVQHKLFDRAIAHLEDRVKREPRNPQAHADLGMACIQKLQTVSDIEKGMLATKADKSFDAALKLDEQHWEARFLKASSLSFWPPLFGKQPEAVAQFETLRAQQEAQAPQPKFAETYLFLGNLYSSQGKSEKARETWSRGAELFPAHGELGKKAAEAATP